MVERLFCQFRPIVSFRVKVKIKMCFLKTDIQLVLLLSDSQASFYISTAQDLAMANQILILDVVEPDMKVLKRWKRWRWERHS